MGFLRFDYLIVPRILSVCYVVFLLACVLAALANPGNIWTYIFIAVVGRLPFEFIMVTFKNNEYLRIISEKVTKGNKDTILNNFDGVNKDEKQVKSEWEK